MPLPDAYVQVAPDSTGKKIRNLQVQAVIQQTDGSTSVQTVLMQVVSLVDAEGRVLDLDALETQWTVVEELRRVRRLLQLLASEMPTTDDDELEQGEEPIDEEES